MTTPPSSELISAHESAVEFYRDQLVGPAGDGPRRYLEARGFGALARPDVPWRHGIDAPWRLGYAPPGPTPLTNHLRSIGYEVDVLEAAGLTRRSRSGRPVDVFRDRIMFPIRNPDDQPVAFIGRAAPTANSTVPKYLNSHESPIYHKGQTFYGYAEQADRIDKKWAPVVVEGPLDAIAIWLAHPQDAGVGRVGLATCGTSLTAVHADLLRGLPGSARHGITVCYDADRAGHHATERAWHVIGGHSRLQLFATRLPVGSDPADLTKHPEGMARLRAALTHQSRPLVETVANIRLTKLLDRHPDLLADVEGRVAAVRALAPLFRDLTPADAVRLAAHLAHQTGAAVDTVTTAVLDHLHERRTRASPPPLYRTASPDIDARRSYAWPVATAADRGGRRR